MKQPLRAYNLSQRMHMIAATMQTLRTMRLPKEAMTAATKKRERWCG